MLRIASVGPHGRALLISPGFRDTVGAVHSIMRTTALSGHPAKPESGESIPLSDLDNPFWRFSLAVYAAPGVADSCLRLQDGFGVDVNMLLFVAWVAADRRARLAPEDVQRIEDSAARWHKSLVKPVREARRQLKASGGPVYAGIKAAELKLEQIEQALLYDRSRALNLAAGDKSDAIASAVADFLTRHGAPDNAADALIAAARAWR